MPIDQRSLDEIVKSIPLDDLKVIAGALTPFLPFETPPQLMLVDNEIVKNILIKYNLVEYTKDQLGRDIITKVHSDLGFPTFEITNIDASTPDVTASGFWYITPSKDMIDRNNKINSKDGLLGKGSPYDIITSTYKARKSDEIAKDEINKLRNPQKVGQNLSRMQVIAQVQDPTSPGNTVSETVVTIEFDLEWTKRYSDVLTRALMKNPNIFGAGGDRILGKINPLYRVVLPESSDPPTNKTDSAVRILRKINPAYNIDDVFQKYNSLSPAAELNATLINLETATEEFKTAVEAADSKGKSDGLHGKGLEKYVKNDNKVADLIAKINALIIKLTNEIGVNIDLPNFSKTAAPIGGDPPTIGYRLYVWKDRFIGIRQTIAYLGGIESIIDGLNDLQNGKNSSAKAKFEKSYKYFWKEMVWVPLIGKRIPDEIGDIVAKTITRRKNRSIIPYKDAKDALKNIQKDPGSSPKLKSITGGNFSGSPGNRPNLKLDKASSNIVESAIRDAKAKNISTKISAGIQIGIYFPVYGVKLSGLDKYISKVEDENKRISDAEARLIQGMSKDGVPSPGTDQLLISSQFDGNLIIDVNNLKVINPVTGEIQTTSLVPLTVFSGVTTHGTTVSEDFLGSQSNITQNSPMAPLLNILPNRNDLSPWQKMGKVVVETAHALDKIPENLPPTVQLSQAIETILQFPESPLGMTFGLSGKAISAGRWQTILDIFGGKYVPTPIPSIPTPGPMGSSALGSLFRGIGRTFARNFNTLITFATSPTETGGMVTDIDVAQERIDRNTPLGQIVEERIELRNKLSLTGNTSERINILNRLSTLNKRLAERKRGEIQAEITKKRNEVLLIQFDQSLSDEEKKQKIVILMQDIFELESLIDPLSEIDRQVGPTNTDPNFISASEVALEIEVGKYKYDNTGKSLGELEKLGNQLLGGTSNVPNVSLSNINTDVTFATGFKLPDQQFALDVFTLGTTGRLPIKDITPPSTPGCFPEYVKIKINDNLYIPISKIKVGDKVISFDLNGNLCEDTVIQTFIHENKKIWRYYFSNSNFIDITEEHPVLTKNGDFLPISELKIGDSLIGESLDEIVITKKEYLKDDTVYNIEVEKNHTYIADGIRVHNKLGITYYQQERQKSTLKDAYIAQEDMENRQKDIDRWIEEQDAYVAMFNRREEIRKLLEDATLEIQIVKGEERRQYLEKLREYLESKARFEESRQQSPNTPGPFESDEPVLMYIDGKWQIIRETPIDIIGTKLTYEESATNQSAKAKGGQGVPKDIDYDGDTFNGKKKTGP